VSEPRGAGCSPSLKSMRRWARLEAEPLFAAFAKRVNALELIREPTAAAITRCALSRACRSALLVSWWPERKVTSVICVAVAADRVFGRTARSPQT
jgi:hypothetical protein